MSPNRSIFSGMQILINQVWVKNQAVIVDNGLIIAIIQDEMIEHHLPAERYEYPETYYLIPGLIDLHVHGANGKDVMDASKNALKDISLALAEEGITGFLATTMTAEKEQIESVLKIIPVAKTFLEGADILGVHLEGPFISPDKKGAHGEHQCLPDSNLIKEWQKISENNIKMVTLAPELPEALPFIKTLKDLDIIASVGHTHATYAQTQAAIDAGCTNATHLFNAMRGIHHREPGAAGALLLADTVAAELIVDGLHLHPAMTELALRIKTKERLVLVTDAMRAKCLGDGKYDLGGQEVEVKDGKATLADGTLAGSTLRLPEAIKHMQEFSHCSLQDAIHMASATPARVLKIDAHKGEIAVGKDADLVVMSPRLNVMLTMRGGREIYKKSKSNHKD